MDIAATIDRRQLLGTATAALPLFGLPHAADAAIPAGMFEDIRLYGAKGDGKAIDSGAINRAIAAAARRGGGTVVVPPGKYLCFSIRLLDNITLMLTAGATLIAANPDTDGAHYDAPENYLEEQFQDFGITHVHNSLIYADGASNIGIVGPGMIHGAGLDRAGTGERWHARPNFQSAAALGISPRELALRDPAEAREVGRANKAIGLMRCHNVRVADVTILLGGHFALMAHGCSSMRIDGLMIDTDRDGIDIDCCRDVRVLNCTVNSPKDDAIVLKSSYALGRAVLCEDIEVANCRTSGFLTGSVLDGSYRPTDYKSGPFGRIKLGTETNGGYRNIRIADCICTTSRGILVGIVDGGTLEDVSISGIMLRDPVNHPLFVHHGARLRAPAGTGVGAVRRVRFENIVASGVDPRFPCGIEGLADAPSEDISFSGIEITSRGGGTAEDAARVPDYRRETSLEVNYLRTLPAFGFYARNARRVTLRDAVFRTDTPDARPAISLTGVAGAILDGIASPASRADTLRAKDCSGIALGTTTTLAR